MTKSIRLKAFAKANLSLNITGIAEQQSGKKMHVLDSVMVSVGAFDTVTVRERGDGIINVRFLNADISAADNTAARAAQSVSDFTRVGWDIEIEKGIPVGAGLGGSSADGAAVLAALDSMYGLSERGADINKCALGVGSDVPFMTRGGAARVGGTGGAADAFINRLELYAIGLMAESVSTAAAYGAFDAMYTGGRFCPSDTDALCACLKSGDTDALKHFDNALYEPAKSLAPSVGQIKLRLERLGATACLTGSGGMVLGWFTSRGELERAKQKLGVSERFTEFSVVPSGIVFE